MKISYRQFVCGLAGLLVAIPLFSAPDELPAVRMLTDYFKQETMRIEARNKFTATSLDEWKGEREKDREELREMLGLLPGLERTDLHPVVTGRIEQADVIVEKVQFQSRPGLYVTGDLYLPKNLSGKAPAILYVCGHAGSAKTQGHSPYGAKSIYQYHGAWLARNGYVCLMIDTIENGDIPGVHRGTKWYDMWWWNSRGYTPAGVETWNAMRALDYLQSRPEVDGEKLGMTGRSGGGVTTWFTAALDDRIKVAVPVAGIGDLRIHVIDQCIANHCDCVYMVNIFRWDYPRIARLIAPRPLLMAGTDRDQIFPLAGVLRIHADLANLYQLYGEVEQLGLTVGVGLHHDNQELQVAGLRWFNHYLKGIDPVIENGAKPLFEPKDLAVFEHPPADEISSRAHEFFVPAATPGVPANARDWSAQRQSWLTSLREKSFAAWPADGEPLDLRRVSQEVKEGLTLTHWEFAAQGVMRLPLFVFARASTPASAPVPVCLHVLDETGWNELVATAAQAWPALGTPERATPASARCRALLERAARGEIILACLPPRGIGPTRWSADNRSRVVFPRSFMALGQTVEGMRVWDIRRAIATLRQPEVLGVAASSVQLTGERFQAVNALYASLFTEGVASLDLIAPPASHMTGPDYLNVLRYLDVPQAVAMAAERMPVRISDARPADWQWTESTAKKLGWPVDRLRLIPGQPGSTTLMPNQSK